ncbi:MAG: prefoldin subunit alpha [Candidatus Thalassarchaeaceae archaeon]|nr:prefoldin subunit alpha [Candidatus Thalassarchaeaceae archaeon]
MTEPDRAELQRLAQLVEVNRERLQALEQQIRNLEGIKIEQVHAMEALSSISDDGAKGAMVPLGAGVQIVADIPADAGAVVDIGSRVQAEKTRPEALEILRSRNDELNTIIDTVTKEHDELENHVGALASRFNEIANGIQVPEDESHQESENVQVSQPKRRPRRKRGTELTLDD